MRLGPFDSAATERATTPRATSDGIVTSRNEVLGPRNSAYWTVRSAPGGRSTMSRSSAPHSKEPRISPRSANSLVARQVWDSPAAALSNSSDSDSGISEPIEKTAMPLLLRGSVAMRLPPGAPTPLGDAGGTNTAPWTPAMRAWEGPLKSASRIAIRSPLARSAPARCSVRVLLPTPPLPEPTATSWRTAGQPVGDAGALLGHLLEDSGAAVADDVVIALHLREGASLHRGLPKTSLGPGPRLA